MRKTIMPWLVALTIGAAPHSSGNCAPGEWNEYVNRRFHFSVHYPETYNVVTDLSAVAEREDQGAGSAAPCPNWREANLVGFIRFTSGIGGLCFNIEVYGNKDTLSLEEATDRVLDPIRSLRDCEDSVDSLSIDGKKALRVDVYCAPYGKRLQYSRCYIAIARDLIYAVCFANPEFSYGPLDLITDSEKEIVAIVSSIEWTSWIR